MSQQVLIEELSHPSPSKIIFLVIDGLGGLPHPDTGESELETAHTPNLDRLASESMCGLTVPVGPGITPGSGPGHLGLFGYDPVKNLIKRGVLEATGIGLELGTDDLAVRGNFCTVDDQGRVTDRRAGRIPTEESSVLCRQLNEIRVSGAEAEVHPVKDHRFAIVFHGNGLNEELTDTDAQGTGMPVPPVKPLMPEAQPTADIANEFIEKSRRVLGDRNKANMIMLRGFSKLPSLPSMGDIYDLSPAAIATYPMYKGIARLLGMVCLETGVTFEEEVDTLIKRYNDFDFFFIHFKDADTAGEDGNFEAKVRALEEVDAPISRLIDLNPDVFVVAGDHSTPAVLVSHSWHPVPFLLKSRWGRTDRVERFNEKECAEGVLGRFPSVDIMPLVLANSLRLNKFGA